MINHEEIPLTGGRITQGVVRIGAFVHRPECANSAFARSVLRWLEQKEMGCCPRYIGHDERGREITTYLPGWTPADLGFYTDAQLLRAVSIIKSIHTALIDFPGCTPGKTVCHYDLSPCNFIFQDNLPYAVIDWDTAAIGDPLDDLAYAAWMWLDMGNEENEASATAARLRLMLDCYGVIREERPDFCKRIFSQMERVQKGPFLTEERALLVSQWVAQCADWLAGFAKSWIEQA